MDNSTLFEKLCKVETLYQAWVTVKEKNSAGGIDGVGVPLFEQDLEEQLSTLAGELRAGAWAPQPYLSIEIPKDENEKRRLGLLSVRDKVVQCAIKGIVEPLFEPLFVANSYGYRPGKGPTKAVRRALHECKLPTNRVALRLDIDNFFDTINHALLSQKLHDFIHDSEMERLLMLCMDMGVVDKRMRWSDTADGVPQGAVLSPLLSNFFLHEFDAYVLTLGVSYVRYADDFCIMCATREDCERILAKVAGYLKTHLKLSLNTPVVKSLEEGFEFLGIKIAKSGLSLSPEKMENVKGRIEQMTLAKDGLTDKSAKSWKGIKNYYATLLPQDELRALDGMLVDRMKLLIKEKRQDISSKTALKKMVGNIEYLTCEFQLLRKNIMAQYVEAFELTSPKSAGQPDARKNKRIIEQRKREYQKREGEGSELLVNSYGCIIGLTQDTVTVKKDRRIIARRPGSALSHITIIGKGITLSSNVIDYCLAKKISIDFFTTTGYHTGSVLSNRYMESTLWSKQAQCGNEKRMELAAEIIGAKLRNQLNLVKYFHKYHKLTNDRLAEKHDSLVGLNDNFKDFLDSACRDDEKFLTTLTEYEAQGAVKYWAYVRELLSDDEVSFERRERKGATDLVNCMLNYGYAILYSRVWRALLGAKLNPYDSIIHARQDAKPTFVYDVVELFRAQAVDRVVISLVQKGSDLTMTKGLLDADTRRLLAKSILERLNRYEKYRGEEMTMENIILRQAREIAAFIEKDENYRPYIAKW